MVDEIGRRQFIAIAVVDVHSGLALIGEQPLGPAARSK